MLIFVLSFIDIFRMKSVYAFIVFFVLTTRCAHLIFLTSLCW